MKERAGHAFCKSACLTAAVEHLQEQSTKESTHKKSCEWPFHARGKICTFTVHNITESLVFDVVRVMRQCTCTLYKGKHYLGLEHLRK